MWVDVGSLAISIFIESGKYLVKDACWLQLECKDKYINLVDLDAILRGLNMALQCRMTVTLLKTDLTYVHQWVSEKS